MKEDLFAGIRSFDNVFSNFNTLLNGYFKDGSLFGAFNEEVSGCRAWYCYTPDYQDFVRIFKNFSILLKYLNVDSIPPQAVNEIAEMVSNLDKPDWTRKKSNVTQAMMRMQLLYSVVKDDVLRTISYLDDFEKQKLSEAVYTFSKGCYDSSVAMSVCAIESRLFKLMLATRPDKKESFERLTLGQLVDAYLKEKYEYVKGFPGLEKHEELLNLCNKYRILSVHPKEEKVNQRIAESVLNLTFEFLLDRTLKVSG